MSAVELHLPYPPSANRLWRRAGARIHKSDEYKAWLEEAGWKAAEQKPKRIDGPYRLQIQAARPDKRRRDLDNLIKPISDLLKVVGIIRDDSDCDVLSARWVTVGEGVYVVVGPAAVEG